MKPLFIFLSSSILISTGAALAAEMPKLTAKERSFVQTFKSELSVETTECSGKDRSTCSGRKQVTRYSTLPSRRARVIDETLARVVKASPQKVLRRETATVASSGSCHSSWGSNWHYARCDICYPNVGVCCSCEIDSLHPSDDPCSCREQ